MKTVTALVLVGALTTTGCTHVTHPMSAEKKTELRKILDPKFAVISVPNDGEEEFLWVLDCFTAHRKSSELVQSVKFISPTDAMLTYSDGVVGAVAILKRKSGGWRFVRAYAPAADPIQIYPVMPDGPQKSEPNQSLQPTAPSGRG